MEQIKSDSEIIAEIYRNAQLAITSISDIMPEVVDGGIREEIMRQHEEYEKGVAEKALEQQAELKNAQKEETDEKEQVS